MNSGNETYSDYERDCMEGALLPELQPYGFLRNKSIIIASLSDGELERLLFRMFCFLNETCGLKMELYSYFAQDGSAPKECPRNADFLIHTGICNREIENMGHCYSLFDQSFAGLCETVRPKRLILLSDYRILGKRGCPGVFQAEREAGACAPDLPLGYAVSLLSAFEAVCACASYQYGAEYLIIRAGALLGAGLGGCGEIQKKINGGGTWGRIKEAYDVIPYLYISDFLQAVLLLMGRWEKNEVFHAACAGMTYSGHEVMGMRYRLFGEGAKAVAGETGISYAMAADKLGLKGFRPQVDMRQALTLLRRCHAGDGAFAYCGLHGGKIRKIQQLALRVMIEIDKLCRRFEIPYALGGGTLLGAVRHQGFIPWDEDADLIMERAAYEKFLEIAEQNLPDWLFLQTPKTDKSNHFYTKVRVNDTVLSTKFTSRIPGLHQGVFVDIFCHDRTSRHKVMQKAHIYATIISRSMVFNKWGDTKIAGKDGGHALARAFFTVIKNLVPMSVLEKLQFWIITCYKNKNTGYLYDGMGQNVRNGAFPREWLEETVMARFETCQFPIPKEYDKYLTYLYGDYKKMIPVRKRFDDSYAKRVDLGRYFWLDQ